MLAFLSSIGPYTSVTAGTRACLHPVGRPEERCRIRCVMSFDNEAIVLRRGTLDFDGPDPCSLARGILSLGWWPERGLPFTREAVLRPRHFDKPARRCRRERRPSRLWRQSRISARGSLRSYLGCLASEAGERRGSPVQGRPICSGRSARAAPITITSAGIVLATRRICVPACPCLTAAPI